MAQKKTLTDSAHWGVDTALTHLGRDSALLTNSVNSPLVRASTTVFPTLAEFKESYQGIVFESPRYGRSGTSTNFELQSAMAQLCGTESCIATPSGLSAISAVIAAHSRLGGHILLQESIYGPAKVFAEKMAESFQCCIDYFDSVVDFEEKLKPETSLVFIEVPSSLTMQMIDVTKICAIAKQRGLPVACDSTWGTPIFFDAHGLGVDISVHAATKYIRLFMRFGVLN